MANIVKDEQIQSALSRMMIWGVVAAAAVILGGLIWFLSAHVGAAPGDHIFRGEPKYFDNPVAMVQRALDPGAYGERRSVIMMGIVLLLINPLARVAFAALGFVAQRDWLYAGISLLVFAVLLVSFIW